MAHTDVHGTPDVHGVVNHETTDANVRGADRILIFGAVFLAAVFAFIWFLYGQLQQREARLDTPLPAVAARQGDRLPPTPRLQTTPSRDLAAFRQTEDAVLHGYAWVDKQNGIVQIPIERAIDLVVEKGLPPLPAPPPAAPAQPAAGTQPVPAAPAPAPAGSGR